MKIDTSKIENFESLSAEEKLEALTNYEFDDNSEELKAQNAKLKESLNKATGDASKWKKEFQARQTEEERAKAEQEEFIKNLKEQNEQLVRDKNLATLAKGFSIAGEMAEELAGAFLENDSQKFVDKFSKFIEVHDKERDAEALRNMGKPVGGNGGNNNVMTKEQFDKLSYGELVKLKEENPEVYEELNGQ